MVATPASALGTTPLADDDDLPPGLLQRQQRRVDDVADVDIGEVATIVVKRHPAEHSNSMFVLFLGFLQWSN